MNIIITGRKVAVKDSFKERAEKKLAKIAKFFDDSAEAHVTVTVEKNRQTVEVTVKDAGMLFRAEETAMDMLDALDRVGDALVRQIRKNKTRLEKKLRLSSIDDMGALPGQSEALVEETDFDVVRVKRFSIKPMDVDEAILQMNMLGHQFYMFKNVDTGDMNVVYRRKFGDYGLIEPHIE